MYGDGAGMGKMYGDEVEMRSNPIPLPCHCLIRV